MKLNYLALLLLCLPGCLQAQETKQSRSAAINAYLDAVASHGYAGQVLLSEKDNTIYTRAYGYANRRERSVANNTTSFGIASVSKAFTASAILRLEMEGKLKVENHIKQYFPNCPEDKGTITIHQLLTHTSGIAGGDFVEDYANISKDDLVKKIFATPLRSSPGTHWIYSNAGYNLLAAIIEKQSGKEYGAYLEEAIFRPARMDHSFVIKDKPVNAAVSYTGTVANDMPPQGRFNVRTWGGGSVCTTAEDLFSFKKGLFNGSVLTDVARQKMFGKYTRVNNDGYTYYGYGCLVYRSPDTNTNLVDFTGENERGFNCTVRINMDNDETYISVSNSKHVSETWNRWFLDPHIKNLWSENKHFKMPPSALKPEKKAFEGLAGVYKYANAAIMLSVQGDNLVAEAQGMEAVALLYNLSDTAMESYPLLEKAVGDFIGSYLEQTPNGFEKVMSNDQLQGFLTERNDLIKKYGTLKSYTIKGIFPDRNPVFLNCPLVLQFEKGQTELYTMWNMENPKKPLIDYSAPESVTKLSKMYAPESKMSFFSYNFFTDQKDGNLIFEQVNGKMVLKGREGKGIIFSKETK